ncbi:MAG: hypothetical protein LBK92_02155, partial [Endomicrobium sp.]|nr:hypothetical protein [Endomicrobium sp.]
LRFKGFGGVFEDLYGYKIPTRPGYRFRGIRVKVGKIDKICGKDGFTIPGKEITGPVTITAEWDKEFDVTLADPELSAVIGDLKVAYQNDDFHFKGFGKGFAGIANGYPIPTKPGYKFKSIKIQIGNFVERHRNESFTISKDHITGPVTITAEWDKEFDVTLADPELSTVIGDLKAYENNDLYFKGFGPGLIGAGYDIPKKDGYRFKGIKVQIGDHVEEHDNEPFTISKDHITGPVTIAVIWEPASPITFDKNNEEEMTEVPEGEFYYKGDTFHFKGFNSARSHFRGYKEPVKRGYKLISLEIKNGSSIVQKSREDAYAGFDMKVEGPINITYIWEEASPITFDTAGGSNAPKLPENEFYYKGDDFHFGGFGGYVHGYYDSTKPGHKFAGVRVQNGDQVREYSVQEAKDGFHIKVEGNISITYLWESPSPITFDTAGGNEEAPKLSANEFYYKDSTFQFKGFYTGTFRAQMGRYGYTPTKPGYKFRGVRVRNGDQVQDYIGDAANNGFKITVQGPISITYLWDEDYHITLGEEGEETPTIIKGVFHEGDNYNFVGFGSRTFGYWPVPKKLDISFLVLK